MPTSLKLFTTSACHKYNVYAYLHVERWILQTFLHCKRRGTLLFWAKRFNKQPNNNKTARINLYIFTWKMKCLEFKQSWKLNHQIIGRGSLNVWMVADWKFSPKTFTPVHVLCTFRYSLRQLAERSLRTSIGWIHFIISHPVQVLCV